MNKEEFKTKPYDTKEIHKQAENLKGHEFVDYKFDPKNSSLLKSNHLDESFPLEQRVIKASLSGETVAGECTDKYKYCNHHHEIKDNEELVTLGGCEFVADKAMLPLLKALNEIGLKTRTHNYSKDQHSFISIILDETATFEIRKVYERDAERATYNGETELLIQWKATVSL